MLVVPYYAASVTEGENGCVFIDVTESWFVYGMMRLLVTTLVHVGKNQLSVSDFTTIVALGDRARILEGAPARGLCLVRVNYGQEIEPFAADEGDLPVHACFTL